MVKRRIVIGFCLGAFLLGILVARLSARLGPGGGHQAAAPEFAPANPDSHEGEWGNLEELAIPLGDEADIFVDRSERLKPASWFFEHYSKERLEVLLRSCELTEAQWGLLQKKDVVTVAPNGIVLAPPEEFVWALGPGARARLYGALGKIPANYTQNSPFCFSTDRFAARLAETGLASDLLARIKSLGYTNNGALCFADLQLLPGILSADELDRVSEALYRVPTYRLRLRVHPDSDIDALVKYWGQGGREKFIRPLLESLTKVAHRTNGVSINISYLLPPTARLRLFTYPKAWAGVEAERQDCFWTALNFFHDPPEDRYLDGLRSKEALAAEYSVVTTKATFGDLIVLINSAGNGLHACVYIADDFVFTKNGVNKLQPWVLMKLADMLAIFSVENPSRVVTYRRKPAP